jgi:RNA polymerase sigma factor (sigma-70 family)
MAAQSVVEGLGEHVVGLRRYAFALTGNREDAEDLVQETLTRAIAAANSFRATGSLRAWLFAIMHNTFLSGVRERPSPARETAEEAPEMAEPPHQLARLEVRDVLTALGRLPEPQRAAISLIALEDFSYAEAARTLGVPLGTLMSRLARGREALRRIMKGEPWPQLHLVRGAR